MPMMEKIDPNFLQTLQVGPEDAFWAVTQPPFSVHGLLLPLDQGYRRLPESMHLNPNLAHLSRHTAGGRIRFATDAAYVHVCVTLDSASFMAHMPLTGSSGVDVFVDDRIYAQTIKPAISPEGCKLPAYGATVQLPGEGLRTVALYLPLYDAVKEVLVGLPKSARLTPPRSYRIEKPVVFYGSSITQGGCASRTSLGHCALLARFLDAEFVNLGFSGNAKGEPEMARYIAGLEMSCFVLDYDHNTPNPEHLERTHGPFYEIVRQAQPDLPIVMISSPNSDTLKEGTQRRAVIRATYDRAMARGDRKVYYVPGDALLGLNHRECCRVDGIHPNDLGFMRMAETILPVLATALESPRE